MVYFRDEGVGGSTTTDSGGHYGIDDVRFDPRAGPNTIVAHYAGDSDHGSSSAEMVLSFPATPKTTIT